MVTRVVGGCERRARLFRVTGALTARPCGQVFGFSLEVQLATIKAVLTGTVRP